MSTLGGSRSKYDYARGKRKGIRPYRLQSGNLGGTVQRFIGWMRSARDPVSWGIARTDFHVKTEGGGRGSKVRDG